MLHSAEIKLDGNVYSVCQRTKYYRILSKEVGNKMLESSDGKHRVTLCVSKSLCISMLAI